jgi:hypothetical protein
LAISLPSVVGVAGWPCVRDIIGRSANSCASSRAGRSNPVKRRQHRFVTRRLQHQGVRKIVDVLGGTREVDELGDAHHFGVVRQALPDPVLQRLDVVIGYRLDLFHLGRLLRTEIGQQRSQLSQRSRRESRNLGKMRLGGERLEPFEFDLQAAPDQPVFGKLRAQRIHLAGVAAVER